MRRDWRPEGLVVDPASNPLMNGYNPKIKKKKR